jgi:hypothetical protein
MSNVDKHRTINLTIWHAIALRWDITSIPPGIKIHSHWLRPIGPIESGAILAEMRFTNEGPAEAAVETYKEFYFTVAFGEGAPLEGQFVQTTLRNLVDCVKGTLEALSPFVAT